MSAFKDLDKAMWLEAERKLAESRQTPQPKNTVTVRQYAALTGRSDTHAYRMLTELVTAGSATREKWGKGMVYGLKN